MHDPLLADSRVLATEVVVRDDIEQAYRRLYPSLVRLAYVLVDTPELAEEAVQEAFTKAFGKWSRIDNVDAYMRTCVVNACRKVQRRRLLCLLYTSDAADE